MKNEVANTIGCLPITFYLIFDDNSHLVFKWIYSHPEQSLHFLAPLAAKL